jgi:hypothetical protein
MVANSTIWSQGRPHAQKGKWGNAFQH